MAPEETGLYQALSQNVRDTFTHITDSIGEIKGDLKTVVASTEQLRREMALAYSPKETVALQVQIVTTRLDALQVKLDSMEKHLTERIDGLEEARTSRVSVTLVVIGMVASSLIGMAGLLVSLFKH
jgi:hypothetical protein